MSKHTLILVTAAAISFTVNFLKAEEVRFDHLVRNDIFMGFAGNSEALARGVKTLETVLAKEPQHPEALVWHGSALLFQSNGYFQKGEMQKGMELFTRGLAEMDKAKELAPRHVGVLSPRAATLLGAALPSLGRNPMAEQMIQNAIADYEAILEIQKDYWTKVGTHPRGEVLQGLGNAYRALGNKEKANHYFDRIRTELPETPYAKRAATWFEKGDLTLRETQCIGCHTGK